ncbi:GTPase IMAP family member GIMD1-like [Kryptolebias marmoratus]|uniref:GTPase IMAP family member GIMD1-like n=1 Tax=Kryptolebias marmoratus TaxID=37003 RepID=UPI0007F8A2A1|nr:GTPase IMAP family member GIMD1-like [Kryptolebias marmoratus]
MDDKHGFHGNDLPNILSRWGFHGGDEKRNVLLLNVLLLGDRQSGRSSVGNALIGGQEFQTGLGSSVSMTTAYQSCSRNFPEFFRRQGAESDLLMRVIDTPPLWLRPKTGRELCPEGVHVLLVVVRVDRPEEGTQIQQNAERLFGPEWRRHALLVFTHADHLKRAGPHPSVFLTQTTDWLKAMAEEVRGGVCFLDNSSDWPSVRGRALRDQLLRLSARNHHKALRVRTEVSL